MRFLIIGGTGFISGNLTRKLLEAGHTVVLLTRGLTKTKVPSHPRLSMIHGDRANAQSLEQAAREQTFDVVYDMVAYRPEDSAAVAKIFRGKIARFIHCSTISVYMVSHEVLCPITEDQDKGPLMDFFPRNPFGMEYGIQKRGCEEVLWKAHHETLFPVSMLRPTFVCGPGDPSKRDFFWIERILDGGPLLVPGNGEWAFQSVYVEDVAQAFLALLNVPSSVGQAFNVAGQEILSLNDYLKMLSSLLRRNIELVHVDQEVFDRLSFSVSNEGDVFTFNTRRTAVFSLEKIKRDLNFRPTNFSVWMQSTIDWFVKQPEIHSNGYRHRQEEISFARKWQTLQREARQHPLNKRVESE